jgi:hypothetical protein
MYSALVGAAAGAISSAVYGQNIEKGLAYGAIGGLTGLAVAAVASAAISFGKSVVKELFSSRAPYGANAGDPVIYACVMDVENYTVSGELERMEIGVEKMRIILDAWDKVVQNPYYKPVVWDCDDQNVWLMDYLLRQDEHGRYEYKYWSFELLTGSTTKSFSSFSPNMNLVLVYPNILAQKYNPNLQPFTLSIYRGLFTITPSVKVGTYESFVRDYPYNYDQGVWFPKNWKR